MWMRLFSSTCICWAPMWDQYGREDWKKFLSVQDVKLGSLGKATKYAVGSPGPSDVETGIESMAAFLYVSLLLF